LGFQLFAGQGFYIGPHKFDGLSRLNVPSATPGWASRLFFNFAFFISSKFPPPPPLAAGARDLPDIEQDLRVRSNTIG
jgi:hypothetical protein